MATALENIEASINNISERINELTESAGPNYSVDGQSVNKADYLITLGQELEQLQKMRLMLAGAFEERTYGY